MVGNRQALHWGPQAPPACLLSTSVEAQKAVRNLYYELNELAESGSWSSAGFASLGKMEYHVPSAALLSSFHDWAMLGARDTCLPDNAMKCGVRHFDLRVVHGCNLVDTEVADRCASSSARAGSPPPSRHARCLRSRLLSTCTKDPITLSDVGN